MTAVEQARINCCSASGRDGFQFLRILRFRERRFVGGLVLQPKLQGNQVAVFIPRDFVDEMPNHRKATATGSDTICGSRGISNVMWRESCSTIGDLDSHLEAVSVPGDADRQIRLQSIAMHNRIHHGFMQRQLNGHPRSI